MKFLRKTVIGIGTLAMTAVCLTSTTYAWFKINSEAKVDGFELNVTGGNGFMVSIDGVNYANDLKKEDIYKAMVVNYAPDRYLIHYNEEKKQSYVYQKIKKTDSSGNTIYEVDSENNPILDSDGKQIPVYDLTDENIVSDKEISTVLKNVELLPVTSEDGVLLQDLYNSDASASSGRYVQFTVYFKTVSDYKGKYIKATTYDPDSTYYKDDEGSPLDASTVITKDNYKNYYINDGFTYDIYLNGDETYSDSKNGQESIKISPTKFVSKSTDVLLSADMTAVLNGTPTQLKKDNGDKITVYTANALRLSITDEERLAQNQGDCTNIYELNDFVNGALDLGSYATTYSDLYDSSSSDYSYDLDYKYGYKNNAMYTYYSNLKGSDSALHGRLYSYGVNVPTTISDLTSKDADGNYLYNKKITTLSSGEDGKQITFRIWLEGWDADCFDGLTEAVSTSLSFSSKRIY